MYDATIVNYIFQKKNMDVVVMSTLHQTNKLVPRMTKNRILDYNATKGALIL